MIHARRDYDRIQDPANKIADDEPVFLLRAKDKTAPTIVRRWALEQQNQGSTDKGIDIALEWANTMEKWQKVNGCKLADLPKNPIDDLKEDAEVTSTIIEYLFDNGFDRSSIVKFTKFLESRDQRLLYYAAICKNYNSRKQPLDSLRNDVKCSYRDESELGSCFVHFRNSDEGLDFWTSFNYDWQAYIRNNYAIKNS